MKCASCQRKLSNGEAILAVEEGLVGSRGFVAYPEALLFCSKSCLLAYVGNGNRDIERTA